MDISQVFISLVLFVLEGNQLLLELQDNLLGVARVIARQGEGPLAGSEASLGSRRCGNLIDICQVLEGSLDGANIVDVLGSLVLLVLESHQLLLKLKDNLLGVGGIVRREAERSLSWPNLPRDWEKDAGWLFLDGQRDLASGNGVAIPGVEVTPARTKCLPLAVSWRDLSRNGEEDTRGLFADGKRNLAGRDLVTVTGMEVAGPGPDKDLPLCLSWYDLSRDRVEEAWWLLADGKGYFTPGNTGAITRMKVAIAGSKNLSFLLAGSDGARNGEEDAGGLLRDGDVDGAGWGGFAVTGMEVAPATSYEGLALLHLLGSWQGMDDTKAEK